MTTFLGISEWNFLNLSKIFHITLLQAYLITFALIKQIYEM